jgi:type I restriction enzyme M protein
VADEVNGKNYSLYGQENNGSTWALCRMNMFLHEQDSATIEWGDTINNPKLLEKDNLMKFHIVVANPPFSLDKWGADTATADQFNRFHRGVPPKSKGDYAFISHMIETTYEDVGKVGVIVPHGVLFRGSSEGQIRKKLIDENLLEAVIGLPANLFFGTGIPAAILIFNRGKGANKDILFIDASREFESGKNQNKFRESDIEHIVSTFKSFKAATPLTTEKGAVIEDKYSYRATMADIIENDYNLNIPRYVDTFEEEEEVDIKATHNNITELKKQLSEVEIQMENYLKELNLI